MRASSAELRLLADLELNAHARAEELAARCRMSPSMVRYYTRRLLERGFICPAQPIIDTHGLGFTHFTVYLALHSQAQRKLERMVEFLIALPKVTWVFELGAEYQLGFTVSAKRVDEVTVTLGRLLERFPGCVCDKTVLTQCGFVYCGRRYLAPTGSARTPPLRFTVQPEEKQVDELDVRILAAMANGTSAAATAVARKIKQPLPTVARRIRAMEERKVILGYFHWVRADVLGRTCYIARIRVRGFAREASAGLSRFIRETPEAVFATECVGAWDYEIGIEVATDGGLIPIMRRLHEACGDLIFPAQATPILDYHKFRSFPVEL